MVVAGKVGKYLRVLRVGEAVAAEVRTGVIRADVLRLLVCGIRRRPCGML